MFLLNFNQKHKNRLFIIGKTDLIVSFPCPGSLRDVSNLTLDKRASCRSRTCRGPGASGTAARGAMTHPGAVRAERSGPHSVYAETPADLLAAGCGRSAEDSQADTIRRRAPGASGPRRGCDVNSWFISRRATRSVQEVLTKFTFWMDIWRNTPSPCAGL